MSGDQDPLSAAVRARFRSLRHAGELAASATDLLVQGEAGREQRGTRVRFTLQLQGQRVHQARYRAYGCPHTLAACEWVAERLEQAPVSALGTPAEWARELDIPPAKLGRLLILEDALRAALASADKTQPK
jgi:NifU-like protein involved in Fe-S cluster formation